MEVLASVAGTIAELTVIPIGRQVGYLLFYKQNFEELNEKIEELKAKKVRIEHDVKEERRHGREIEADVEIWQKRVDDTLGEVEKLCEDRTHASVRCWKWSLPNLKSRHQLGRKAKKMSFTIAEMEQKRFDDGVGHVPASGMMSLLFSAEGSEKLGSRNSVKKEVVLSLTDPKISKVGIYGWGGVGKTTLAKEVARHVKDNKLFDEVAIATISETLDVERVQYEIAYQLGFHLEEMSSVGRANQLCARIKMEKSILIILDNLWEKIDLDKFGIPSEQDLKDGRLSLTCKRLDISHKNETYRGCKLLLTSRRLDILQKNETQRNFALQTLDEGESWSLFEDIVGDAIKDAKLKEIATQVVERCAGLPFMIVSIAKSLKYNENFHYWKNALNNLKRVDNEDVFENVFSAFEFTYKQLKDDEMKKVFLLCGVRGPSMWVSDLLKYVIGLDVLKHKDTVEDARNRLYSIIHDLKESCMLLEDDDANETDGIKMHDLVREVAISIARKNEHVFVLERNDGRMQDWPSMDFLRKCTQIILKRCFFQELPQKLHCPNLKFFHLDCTDNCTPEIPDSFFEGMGNLEALDLTGLTLSSLPRSLFSLTKLKTLCLDQCNLKHITGIGALMNLEILSFIYSSMEEFPSEIGKLAHLKMLDLSNSRIEIIPPNTLSKLTKLEELYMGNASIKWQEESSSKQNKSASIDELGCLTSLTALEIKIREAWILSLGMMFDKLERYKVIIGDKWEWSGNERTSGLLKLKLESSIHSKPAGIKALIKQAEDLYLDEVIGILDVLFELDGEGFPLLKHLHIQNNGQVQHIINTMRRNETHELFPKLETLTLHNLNNLVKICHGPLPDNSFAKLTVIKVKSCDQLVYLFSGLMVKALSQLVQIEVSECSSMKRIVLTENKESGIATEDKIEFYSLRALILCHLPAIRDFCSNEHTTCLMATSLFNGIKVSFSNLETLKLSSINLEKIWDNDRISAPNCFHNLASLIVEDCRGLKHLFSSSVVGSFLKLKHLEVSKCEMMEEIIAPTGRNNTALQEVRFSKLETIVVKDMKSLTKVWHFEFGKVKTLEVSDCEKLVNIFPSDMQETFGSLETLKVSDCGSVEVIFELTAKEIEDQTMTQVSQLKKLHLLGLPKLKQIWSRDAQANICFPNLQLVFVQKCESLEYLFPFSIAMQAIQLEDITVKYAWSMKNIVSDKEGPMDGPVKFEFNHLTSLVLWRLYELEGIFAQNRSVLCPLLKKLDIRGRRKLKLFKTQSTSGPERVFDSKLQISMSRPLFTLEEVICNLETLAVNSEDASMILQGKFSGKHFSKLKLLLLTNFEDDNATFPYWFLQNITTLNELLVEWSSFKEIFQDKGNFFIRTRIKTLTLYQLHDLQHICKEGFQIDPVLEVLEYLEVDQCSKLKHLVPSSVTFSHLTHLEVGECDGLIHLITSSTARSLVKLRKMKIMKCNSLEQVVAEEREGSEDEIAFSSLEILEFHCLPMIERFCSCNCFLNLPLLEEVVVKECPRMKIFSGRGASTPKLQKISSKEDEEVYWEGDLNRTLDKMFEDKVAFNNFSHLEFSKYPELEELWNGQIGQKIFCNIKHMVVRKCTFLSNMLFSSNLLKVLYKLEELEVAECDSLEAVFDVKALDDKAMELKEVSGLKKLTLSGLSNLKRIWNREAGEIISFGNLQIVRVDKCQHLKYLFPVSLCPDLRQLEKLHIESCGVEEIVSIEEGLEELKFDFPRLTILRLLNLRKLTNFCPTRYTIECPLKELNVRGCEELQIFAFDHLNSQPLEKGDIELQTKQALFYIEKVSQYLEELPLNENDTVRILKGKYEKILFQSIKILRLQYFQETPGKFLNDLIQIFPSITKFQVRCSSFKTLFPSEEISCSSIAIPTQIKTLWLFQLEQLEHIWSDDVSASHALVQNLESLIIVKCSRIIRLTPPSVSFKNLTSLEVRDCNGLVYLMTSCTAKSFIHLTSLTVINCRMLEEVVMTNKGDSEEEIIFERLKCLELTCLSRFKSFCFGKHTFILPSLGTCKVIGCHKMQNFSYGVIIAPFLKSVEVENRKKRWKENLNTTIQQLFIEKAIEGVEGDCKESSSINMQSSQMYQKSESTSRALSSEEHRAESKVDEIVDSGKQEMPKIPIPHTGVDTQKIFEIPETPMDQTSQNKLSLTKADTGLALETQDETIERPLVQATHQGTLSSRTKEMRETIQIQNAKGTLISASDQDTAVRPQDTYESRNESVHDTQNVLSPTMVHDAAIHPAPSQASKATSLSTTPVADVALAIGTLKIHDTMDKSMIQTNQDAEKLATAQNTAIDPSASQAPEPMISPIQKSNIYKNYKGMIDITEQSMPYLEAGVKRHPQVLDWLNTEQPRVLASSSFSLFAEVTRILRTTRRGHLTENDRNNIRKCCTILEMVGFDTSWLSYVYKCIEQCGDGEDIKRKVEEAKSQASNLKAQLESIKKELASAEKSLELLLDNSLELLLDKASELDVFIES